MQSRPHGCINLSFLADPFNSMTSLPVPIISGFVLQNASKMRQPVLFNRLKMSSCCIQSEKAAVSMAHYCSHGDSECSAVRRLLWWNPFWILLFLSCQDAFYFAMFCFVFFWCCDNLKPCLCNTKELESHRIHDTESVWSIYEWPLTAGERWTARFPRLLFVCCLPPPLSPRLDALPPNWTSHSASVWKSTVE